MPAELYLRHDGLDFHYLDVGSGLPFVFQHGLGGDVSQPFELYAPQPGVRLLTMDSRGHGMTRPTGAVEKFSFASFADDLRALLDHLDLQKAVVGGISMGAGVALNFALRYPERACGLVLVRPAWLAQPMPDNLQCMVDVGRLIRCCGAPAGRAHFLHSALYAELQQEAPYTAASLLGQFDDPRAEDAVVRLERLPNDAPTRDTAAWTCLRIPTLIVAARADRTHPFACAEELARAIPNARLVEITSKAVDKARHVQEGRAVIATFLADLCR